MKKLDKESLALLNKNLNEIQKLINGLKERINEKNGDIHSLHKALDMIIFIAKTCEASTNYAVDTNEIILSSIKEGLNEISPELMDAFNKITH